MPSPRSKTVISAPTCEHDSLVARSVEWWFVTWCDLDLGSQLRTGSTGIATYTGSSEPEEGPSSGRSRPGMDVLDSVMTPRDLVSLHEPA